MLSDNHICKLNSQIFEQMQIEYMRKEIDNKPCSLLLTLRDILVENQDACYAFASQAYLAFLGKRWVTEDDFQMRYLNLATYGVLMCGVVFGYDKVTGKTALYTTSMGVLRYFASNGMLKGKKQPIAIELETIQKALYESDRIKKSLRGTDNKLVTVRLDCELDNGRVVMYPTVPRSAITLDSHILVPFTCYKRAMENIQVILQKYILRITMGDKVRDVTLNKQLLGSIYGDNRAETLISYIPDIYTRKFYLPSVGASKYSVGVTNIDLIKVDEVNAISLADVNLTDVNLDLTMVNEYVTGIIEQSPDNVIKEIALTLGMEKDYIESKDISDLRQDMYEIVEDMFGSTLYDIMKACPTLYRPDVYRTIPNKYGSLNEQIPIPRTVNDLQNLFNNGGIYKVVSTKRNGSFTTVICSNDKDILKEFLGTKSIEYESEGVRLRRLKHIITKDGFDDSKLGDVVSRLFLVGRVFGNKEQVLKQVDNLLHENELNKTVCKQADLVTVKNLQAKNNYDFYKNFDIRQIREIIRLR